MVNSLIKIVDIILILVGTPKAASALTYKLKESVSSALLLTVIIPNVKVLLNILINIQECNNNNNNNIPFYIRTTSTIIL